MATKHHPPVVPCHLLLLHLVLVSVAGANAASIATYWGQNEEEGSLIEACATQNYEYVNIAFLTTLGSGQDPVLDLSGHCNPTGGGCAGLGEEISACQRLGVKIMLSLGGDRGRQSLASADDAWRVAEYLYVNFLGGKAWWPRPFGGAVLDGVDFSVAGKTKEERMHWESLARALAGYGVGKGKIYLTAAPRCSYPDRTLKRALGTGLFDVVWIRFYGHPSCEYSPAGGLGSLLLSWNKWSSRLRGEAMFIGLPASGEAPEKGYMSPENFTSVVLPFISLFPGYGGIMLWNRYYDTKSNYSERIKPAVKATDQHKIHLC